MFTLPSSISSVCSIQTTFDYMVAPSTTHLAFIILLSFVLFKANHEESDEMRDSDYFVTECERTQTAGKFSSIFEYRKCMHDVDINVECYDGMKY